ncbi:MAG: hypothetical protein WCB36_10015 [Burkholderiales bacterium]
MKIHLKKTCIATNFALLLLAVTALPAVAAGTCNLGTSVGGGTANVSPSAGAGWDVGSGQCNGDFTVITDSSFPGGVLELGMRIEQRLAGQLNPPQHSGTSYEVQTGPDPSTISIPYTNGTRAWWNFQHSIAYNGGANSINSLDGLSFAIRTDVGIVNPAAPAVDMLFLRGIIDDRHTPKTTAAFSDLYQTSQNPVFGWFAPTYNLASTAPGAWMMTLAAVKSGRISSVSICAHTTGQVCAAPPVVYTCTGFDSPMDQTISVKKKANRVLPLKMSCTGNGGAVLGTGAIAAPVLQVTKASPAGEETTPADTYLSAGQGTDGNEFVYNGSRWMFNLQTKNFTGVGTYTITVVAGGTGGSNILVNAPTATFVVQ